MSSNGIEPVKSSEQAIAQLQTSDLSGALQNNSSEAFKISYVTIKPYTID